MAATMAAAWHQKSLRILVTLNMFDFLVILIDNVSLDQLAVGKIYKEGNMASQNWVEVLLLHLTCHFFHSSEEQKPQEDTTYIVAELTCG